MICFWPIKKLKFFRLLTDMVKEGVSKMVKQSFVLKALRIIGLDDIQRITEIIHIRQAGLKKAAGEELVFWEDHPVEESVKAQGPDAKVIPFTKKDLLKEAKELMLNDDIEKAEEAKKKLEEHTPGILSADALLWQRDMAKSAEGSLHKIEAMKGYKRSTEMYVVKTHDESGKEKLKFASTGGVLVNKKQA